MASEKTQALLEAFANASAESKEPFAFPGLESVFAGRSIPSSPHTYVRSVQKCLSLKEGTEKGEWCELANKFLDWKCAHPGDHLPGKAILDKLARSAPPPLVVACPPPFVSSGSAGSSTGTLDQGALAQYIHQQQQLMDLVKQKLDRPAPLAIEDAGGKLARVEDAAVKGLIQDAEENGLEDKAIEKMIDEDDGTLEAKAIAKIIEDDTCDVVEQAIRKLIENDDGTLKRQAITQMVEEDDGELEEQASKRLRPSDWAALTKRRC